MKNQPPELRDVVAARLHAMWSEYLRSLLFRSYDTTVGTVIPESLVKRWEKLAWTEYNDLCLEDQAMRRAEADGLLAVIQKQAR